MKYMKMLGVAVVGFVVIAATLVGGGIALAAGGGGTETRQRAEFTIMGDGVTADFKLRLRIRDQDERFRASVNGEGFAEGDRFSLCIEGAFGVLFIEDDGTEADGTLVIEEEFGGGITF